MSEPQASATVVRFPGVRRGASPWRDQKALLDAVYTAGSLPIGAGDLSTKRMAARLQILGFLQVDEVAHDGGLRRLLPSETVRADGERPWRVSRPKNHSFFSPAGRISLADGAVA
jgi:hypothetical protein